MKKAVKIIIIILIISGVLFFVWKNFFDKSGELPGGAGQKLPVETTTSVVEVEEKTFDSSIQTMGTTKIRNEQNLRFNVDGKVVAVNYSVGDKVKKGDIISRMASEELQNEIERQKINISDSERKLADYIDDLKTSGIKKSFLDLQVAKDQLEQRKIDFKDLIETQKREILDQELSLQQARNSYDVLKRQVDRDIAELPTNLNDKKTEIEDKIKQLDKLKLDFKDFDSKYDEKLQQKLNEYNNELKDLYFGLQTSVSDMKEELKQVYQLYGMNHESKFEYFDLFSAKNSSYKEQGKSYVTNSQGQFERFEDAVNSLYSEKDTKGMIKALKLKKSFYESFYDATNAIVLGFENSVESVNFDSSTIDSYKSKFSSMRSTARGFITSIVSQIDQINNMKTIDQITRELKDQKDDIKKNIDDIEKVIDKMKKDQNFEKHTQSYNKQDLKIKLAQTKISLDKQISDFDKLKQSHVKALKQANIALEREKIAYQEQEKQYNNLVNYETNQEYIVMKNQIKQEKIALDNIYEKIENYIIKAPFDGVITKIDIKVGDRLNADNQQFISIVDPETVQVDTKITQFDIVKVKKGMQVTIKLDTYPEEIFTGEIVELDTTPKGDDTGGGGAYGGGYGGSSIKSFSAVVSLNNPKKLKIYSGISANITINYSTIPQSVVVPFSAVNTDEEGRTYVTVVGDNNKQEKRHIEVGFSDGEYYQVLTGVAAGENILEIDYNPSQFQPDKPEYFGPMGG